MEIRIENPKKSFNLTIKDKIINGIMSTNKEELAYKLSLRNEKEQRIYINNKQVSKEEIYSIKNRIRIVPERIDSFLYRYKVYEWMYEEIKRNELELKDPKKKVLDSLKIVGLDITYLYRNINDLSSSEKKLLQIGIALMSNPELIILVEPFKDFDLIIKKRIISLIQVMKEQYDKTMIIISDDINMLYNDTEHLIIEKNHKILIEGNSKEILEEVEFLEKHKIDIPEIVEFTYKANQKKAKIDYHKDIRDLIKDIYKHI